jgi:hypothetical protein
MARLYFQSLLKVMYFRAINPHKFRNRYLKKIPSNSPGQSIETNPEVAVTSLASCYFSETTDIFLLSLTASFVTF